MGLEMIRNNHVSIRRSGYVHQSVETVTSAVNYCPFAIIYELDPFITPYIELIREHDLIRDLPVCLLVLGVQKGYSLDKKGQL